MCAWGGRTLRFCVRFTWRSTHTPSGVEKTGDVLLGIVRAMPQVSSPSTCHPALKQEQTRVQFQAVRLDTAQSGALRWETAPLAAANAAVAASIFFCVATWGGEVDHGARDSNVCCLRWPPQASAMCSPVCFDEPSL